MICSKVLAAVLAKKLGMQKHRLTSAFIRTVKPAARLRTFGDGRGGYGLTLAVKPNGVKYWYQRVYINRRPVNLGLGGYPAVSLAEARRHALANARLARRGEDPRRQRHAVPTVSETLEAVIARDAPTWRDPERTAREWRSALQIHAAVLLQRPVDQVTSAECIEVLSSLWHSKRETGLRLRHRLTAIFKFALAQGYRTDNPVDAAKAALPNRRGDDQRKRRHAALPYADVADALNAVEHADIWTGTKLAFRFLVLTATRSGEVRGATRSEIDSPDALWTIPGSRMKAGIEHRVPLSTQAMNVIAQAERLPMSSGDLIFPTVRGKLMMDNALSKPLRDLGIAAVPHGFRSSFRDWAAERTATPTAVVEAALAHRVSNKVEAAYFRSDLLDKRRELMQAWSDFLAPVASPA